jgi:hypothetical protein
MSDAIIYAVGRLTDYVREWAAGPMADSHHYTTEAERADWRKEINTLCDKLELIADDPASTFRDFDRVRVQLYRIGGIAPPAILNGVTDAYFDAGRMDATERPS